ncbi:MAG: hypothetical protein QM749_14515 [Aquabacterium sp.]
MATTNSTSLDQLHINEDHPFVTLVTPARDAASMPSLAALFEANRAFFMDKVARRGVVMFRGFTPVDTAQFNEFVTAGIGLNPWDGFNLKGTPAFITNWLRKYIEGLMGAGDYRRYLGNNAVQLGPVAVGARPACRRRRQPHPRALPDAVLLRARATLRRDRPGRPARGLRAHGA